MASRAKILPLRSPKDISSTERLRWLLSRRLSLLREKENYEKEFATGDWPQSEWEGFLKATLRELKELAEEIAKLKSL